jgi:hypothetical protein
MSMQLHVNRISYNRISYQLLCTGVFNAAEKAELCSPLDNYGRSADPFRSTMDKTVMGTRTSSAAR